MITDLDIDLTDDDGIEPFLIALIATSVISILYYTFQFKLGPEL